MLRIKRDKTVGTEIENRVELFGVLANVAQRRLQLVLGFDPHLVFNPQHGVAVLELGVLFLQGGCDARRFFIGACELVHALGNGA